MYKYFSPQRFGSIGKLVRDGTVRTKRFLRHILPPQVYAKWSQRLNREIYVAYAEANGNATEALGNIRTVKAMSTELQGLSISVHVGQLSVVDFFSSCDLFVRDESRNRLPCCNFYTAFFHGFDASFLTRNRTSIRESKNLCSPEKT